MWSIYKDDHSDLNFAIGCLFCDAINIDEFKYWIELVISSSKLEDIPAYIYDMLDFDGDLYHISKVIGFDIINDLSKSEEYSIYGIAYLRNNPIYECPIGKDRAVILLNSNRYILERFERFFPFIKI
ncbi:MULTISPECIES: hypothetical protein [Mannheimia]|uniref:Uncharacterized protein n=1 Tax=Mannheimia pernigra TaxID=111844 RepID=A0ABD7A8K8_9PAST|nr:MULTISPECIES: hypothetical protein [Mannheimia]QLB42323.1 hypothetical protein HV560_05630 [Mannheimia pernigra]QTM00443.1 hypothetical protein GM698_01800 [Mannheimia sp. ZY171111]